MADYKSQLKGRSWKKMKLLLATIWVLASFTIPGIFAWWYMGWTNPANVVETVVIILCMFGGMLLFYVAPQLWRIDRKLAKL